MRQHARAALCALPIILASVESDAHAGILLPDGTYGGRTYNEWQVFWWQTAFATPVVNGNHPAFSGGSLGEDNGVMLLTGAGGGVTVNLSITGSTALFFPILNIESSVFEAPPFHGDDEASLTANSTGLLDQSTDLFAVIDGVSVDLTPYRFVSPMFEWGPLPADNILGAPAGTTSQAVDAGYYLLLTPLGVGSHTIHFGGVNAPLGGSIDITYNITVVPEPATLASLAIGAFGSLAYSWRRQVRRTAGESAHRRRPR